MSKTELTPFFPDDTHPVRSGVYQTRAQYLGSYTTYSYWSEAFQKWGSSSKTKSGALKVWKESAEVGAFQKKEWRGRNKP